MDISHLVTGPMSVNTWLVPNSEGGVFVVDPGGNDTGIIARISDMGKRISAIILTHGHFDHLIAVPALKKQFPSVPVLIHRDDSAYLGPGGLERHRLDFSHFGGESLVDQLGQPLPEADGCLSDGDTLPGDASWRVIHTPGHSPGSVCLYNEKEKILLAGDTLFCGGYGRTDLAGGSFTALRRSLAVLAALPRSVRVLSGHGGETTIGAEFDM